MKKKIPVTPTEGSLIGIIVLYCVVVTVINPAFLSLETLFDILVLLLQPLSCWPASCL